MLFWVLPAGLAIGLALGALGGGGSILTVPALVYLLGQDAAVATTGSLVVVGTSALMGMAAHARAGRVRLLHGAVFGVLGTAGSYAGSRLSAHVPSPVLLSAFAGLLLVVAALMARRARAAAAGAATRVAGGTEVGGSTRHTESGAWTARGAANVILAATGVGLLTGFFGVGGGFAIVPALVLVLGFEMPTAVGTSLLVIAINSATAFATRLHSGVTLDWPVILGFTGVAVVGSLLGARLAHRLDPRPLNTAFTGLLVLVGIYIAVMNVPRLFSGG